MTYRISENFTLPFKIMCIYSQNSHSQLTYEIKLKALYDGMYFAQNVVLKVPVPKSTIKSKNKPTKGKAKYEADKHAVVWRIKKFLGEEEAMFRSEVDTLPEGFSDWKKPPLKLDFQLPMCTASGLKVLSLRVTEKQGYKPVKWIRYLAKSGDFTQRV